MERILLMHPVGMMGDTSKVFPGITVTANLEQVCVLIKEKQVGRVCIIFDTLTGSPTEAVKKIHSIDPALPVLVWDGSGYKPEKPEENETFLDMDDFGPDRFLEKTKKFLYEGFYY